MPSVITDDLCSYLHALAETRVEAAPPHDNETKRSEFQEQATTLTERVQTLIRTIPVESQKVGVSLEWFRIRLRGRDKGLRSLAPTPTTKIPAPWPDGSDYSKECDREKGIGHV